MRSIDESLSFALPMGSSVDVIIIQTLSDINYELDLGGTGLGHIDTSCDVVTMTLRVPRG
jgi:hypothetical protein